MSDLIYQASVYERTVKYNNFKGKTQEAKLYFALDPLQLLSVIASIESGPKSKSKNPAKQGQVEALTNEQQIKFIRELCIKAAGFPSDDGESWEPFEDFGNSIAGKAFLTKLTSSDADRQEFTEKVVLDPFRAFVDYASNDPSNSKNEVDQLQNMVSQLENIFKEPAKTDETLQERRERLQRELEAMEGNEDSTES